MIIISIPRQISCNEEEMVGLQGFRIVNGKVHEKDRDTDIRRPRVRSSCLVAMRKGVQSTTSKSPPIIFYVYSVYHSERAIAE